MPDIPYSTSDATLYDENGNPVAVLQDGEIYRLAVDAKVDSSPTFPETGSENVVQYYSRLLGTTGADSGITNMNVNGSVTPVEFYIEAESTYDIRIMNIVITIVDGAISHSKFGAILPLTNGWDLKVVEGVSPTFIITKATTGGELLQQSGSLYLFGNGTTVNIIPNSAVNEDTFLVNVPISEYIPGGFRIGLSGVDKIQAIVNDNLTGLTKMTVRVIGYKHFPSV